MKNILALFFLSFSTFSFTQESLEPLKTNYKLINGFNNIRSSNITNNGFIYLTDTISLPVIDDFSTNKFKNYLTDTSLSNISDSNWYKIYDLDGNRVPLTAKKERLERVLDHLKPNLLISLSDKLPFFIFST